MSWSGWGGLSDIIAAEEERKRQEEEERARQAYELARQQERESYVPAQRTVNMPPPQPTISTPLPGPEVDPTAPPVQQTYDIGTGNQVTTDTVSAPPPPQPKPSAPTPYGPEPRQMDQSLWDVGLAQQPPQQNPWQPQNWYTPDDQTTLTPEQDQRRSNIYATGQQQPEWLTQGQNWLGEKAQQGQEWLTNQGVPTLDALQQRYGENPPPGTLQTWWQNTPGYQYAQSAAERRQNFDTEQLPTPVEAFQKQQEGGIPSPLSLTRGALSFAGTALNRNEWSREVGNRAMDALQFTSEALIAPAQQPIGSSGISAIDAGNMLLDAVLGNQSSGAWYDPARIGNTPNLWFDLATQTVNRVDDIRQVRQQAEQTGVTYPLRNLLNNPESARQTLDLALNKDQRIMQLEQQSQAVRDTDPTQAAYLLAEAQRLRSMGTADIIEEYMNPVKEIFWGIVADPTAYVNPLGWMDLTVEAGKLRGAQKIFNVGEDALANLPDVRRATENIALGPKQAQQAWNTFIQPYRSTGEQIASVIPLVGRTANSKAELDANLAWQGTLRILSEFDDKEDVARILGTLTQSPQQLVDGVAGLTSDVARVLAGPDGTVRWAPGVVGNQEFLRRFPIVQSLGEYLPDMKSLQGPGQIDRVAFESELYEKFFDTSKRFNGVAQSLLPFGAEDVRLVRDNQGNGVLEYINGKGEVVRRTEPLPYAEAQVSLRNVQDSLKTNPLAAVGKSIGGGVQWINTLQKSIMSDLWLALRPANWIGNALGATTNLVANDSYTLLPLGNIMDDLSRKLGGYAANPRLFNTATGEELTRGARGAVGEATSGFIDMAASAVTRDPSNPVSKFMRNIYNVPYGATEIPLPNGRALPVGEQSFYARSFYVPFNRVFQGELANSVTTDLLPKLMQIEGMRPEVAQPIIDKVLSVAKAGGKQDVIRSIRNYVQQPELRGTLEMIGVPAELISESARLKIDDFIDRALPSELNKVMQDISDVLMKERMPPAQTLSLSGKQPGSIAWSDIDLAEEVSWITSKLSREAELAGLDPSSATQQAENLARAYIDARTQSFDRFTQELAASGQNNPNIWSLSMDFWNEIMSTRTSTRMDVDAAGKAAARIDTPDEWARKWQLTQERYAELGQKYASISDYYRTKLAEILSGGEYAKQYDWLDNYRKYAAWDELEFRRIRQISLGNIGEDAEETWDAVIQNNRAMLDNKVFELVGAFMRNPSADNFDIMRYAMERIDGLGAQAAAKLADERAILQELAERVDAGEARPIALTKAAKKYAALRNKEWNLHFDGAAIHTEEMARAIIWNGFAERTQTGLRWFDADGIEWRLVGAKTDDGRYPVMRSDTGQTTSLQAASTMDEATPFTVPLDVVNDYERMMGSDLTPAIDSVMDDIASTRPDTASWRQRLNDQIAYAANVDPIPAFADDAAPVIDDVVEQAPQPDLRSPRERAVDEALQLAEGEGPQLVEGAPDRLQKLYSGETKADPELYRLLGVEEGTPLKGTLMEWVQRSRRTNNAGAGQVGDVAQHQINTIDELERTLTRQLPILLQGTENNMTGGQKLRVVDAIADWLPAYDQAVAIGAKVGDEMSGWTMLNYNDRRGFDSILQLMYPYHYFWSRMLPRVAMNGLQKPGLINAMYEINRGIDLENQQSDLPDRLSGTTSFPYSGRLGVTNIFRYIIPDYAAPNPFVDPESPGAPVLRWTPGLGPIQQVALDAATDGDLDKQYTFNDMVPIPYSSAIQAYGIPGVVEPGNMPSLTGPLSFFTAPNEWDPYRARRAVSYIAVEEGLNQADVAYANQVIQNQANGRPVEEGIPPERLEAAQALAQRGVTRAAQDRLVGRTTSWATGMPVYPYPQAEADMRQAQGAYFAAGYNPDSGLGGKELQRNFMEQNPSLQNWWMKGDEQPAARGTLNELYDQKNTLREQKTAAEEAAIAAAPVETMSKGEIFDLREQAGAEYQTQIDAIDAQIDELNQVVDDGQPGDPLRGMNPQEVSGSYATSVMWDARDLPGKPEYPGDNATPEQWRVYNEQMDAYRQAQEDNVVQQLTQPVTSTSDVLRDRRGPVEYSENDARELWWHFQNDQYTGRERARFETLDRYSDQRDAAAAQNRADASARVPAGEAYFQRYLDADDETRKEMRESDWRYGAALLAGFDPQVFDGLAEALGPDAAKQYYQSRGDKPEYPGQDADEDTLKAYYKEMDKWEAKYPLANEADVWLNGRDRWGQYDSSSADFTYNQGADYQEAKRIFGEDIFDIQRQANEASLNGTFVQWRNNNRDDSQRLTGFYEWQKALRGEPTDASMLPQARWGMNPAEQNASFAPGDPRQGLQQALPQTPQNAPGVAQQGQPSYDAWGGLGDILGGATQPQQAGTLPSLAATNTPMPDSVPMAGIDDPMGQDLSAYQWAMQNESFADHESQTRQWQARKAGVYATFGPEVGSYYEQYLSLPKGEARARFKAEHPELRAVSLYTWNPNEYQYLSDTYGQDAIMAWANTPAWADTEEAKARRSAYYDANPVAFEINAWLYGRPGGDESDITDDETFSYNFGTDYSEAKQRFGDDIWTIVGNYKRGWDKATKSAYYDTYPQLSEFFDWWYGNLPDTYSAKTSGYGARYGGWGGGWSGGWSYSSSNSDAEYRMDARVNPRYMDQSLLVNERDIPQYRAPQYAGGWLAAGDRLRPPPLRDWQPPRWG